MRKSVGHHKPIIEADQKIQSDSEFWFNLVRIAVAQICQTVGFKGAQTSALEALTDIATRHLTAIAKVGAASANSHGRTESNLPDILVALEDLGSVRGFVGCSDTRAHSMYTSSVVRDLIKFVEYRDEIPFAQALPRRKGGSVVLFQGREGGDRGGEKWRHVPRWLPLHVPVIEKVEGRGRELEWGCLDIQEENKECREERNNDNRVENEGSSSSNKEIEVLGKRGKVRFQIGVASGDRNTEGMVRNLMRCGGIGKRVVCNGADEDENECKNLIAKKKPR